MPARCPFDADGLHWPGILAEIAEVAGPMAAYRVAQAKGGVPAYFPEPEHLTDTHWLVAACGWEAARRIARRLARCRELVPLGPLSGNRAAIAKAIREGLAAGASRRETARHVGVALRTVQRQANDGDQGQDDQHRLF